MGSDQLRLVLRANALVMQNLLYVFSVISGMNSENKQREHLGQSMAYIDDDYQKVLKELLGHNDIIRFFEF